MENQETRFRLRWNEKIVGYSKKIHNSTFYSKDQYAWSGNEIDFNLSDEFILVFDKNRRPIYVNDIIEFTSPVKHKYAAVVFDEILSEIQLITLDGEELISTVARSFLYEHRFVWKSYLFIQNGV